MAIYDSSLHIWKLDPDEVNFSMPLGNERDGIRGNSLANNLVGNAGDNSIESSGGIDTLTGGVGNDTYVIDDIRCQIIEFDNEGIDRVALSSLPRDVEIFYTLPGFVEKLLSDGAARQEHLTGNELDNQIAVAGAPAAQDNHFWIDGGIGADSVSIAAFGHYEVIVDQAGDAVGVSEALADVLVRSRVSFTLGSNIRGLVLTGTDMIDGTGNSLGNTMTGNGAANLLKGLDGNDMLDGGAGADRLEGGAGDDTYFVDDAGDVVIEAADEGNDTLFSTVGLSLADFANVENLTVTGSASAVLTGTAASNILVGGAGDDTIDGAGGADRMEGGTGNDTYVVDSADDVVIEAAGSGIDTIVASGSWSLAGFANVENLTLTSTASAGLTGNALANILIGNAGNDTLDGGAGADRMEGGAGNDTYIIDNADDVVIEAADGGTDTAVVSLDFRMDRLSNVEVLQLADGALATRATGGAGSDHLIGNGAFNILDGGAGVDTLEGGAGSDVYLVDDAADIVIEVAGNGADAVQTSVSYVLSDAAEIEFLTALGSASLALTGNALANTLTGNDGANVLHGMNGNDRASGGAGADRLYGDAGNDTLGGGAGKDRLYGGKGKASQDMFVFDTKLSSARVAKANLDKIYDFGPRYDSIGFDDLAFTNRTIAKYVKKKGGATLDHALKIDKAWFRAGDKALDRNDFFIYNAKTHTLYFDADGSGHKAMVAVTTFAAFESKTGPLTSKDLFLV